MGRFQGVKDGFRLYKIQIYKNIYFFILSIFCLLRQAWDRPLIRFAPFNQTNETMLSEVFTLPLFLI